MKIVSISTALAVSTLLHCGVLVADPSSPPDHTISHHPGLTPLLWCSAAYSAVSEEAALDFGPMSVITQDLRARGLGLAWFSLEVASSLGHRATEVTEELSWQLALIKTMTPAQVADRANMLDCKGMSAQWAWIKAKPQMPV